MDASLESPRPAKRARFEDPADMADSFEDVDDLYGSPPAAPSPIAAPIAATSHEHMAVDVSSHEPDQFPGIPGLGMAVQSPPPQAGASETDNQPQSNVSQEAPRMVPDQRLVRQKVQVDKDAARLEEIKIEEEDVGEATTHVQDPPKETQAASIKPAQDAEFLEAAQVNKDNTEAEWQYDSSDMSSDSDSSSDTSSAADSSDEDYEMMDPATAARMLMAEEGGDDEDGERSKPTGNFQPRTKNEQVYEAVPKPDVAVTPEMKITPLGAVESLVDNFIIIKAQTSGEYQVLEQGSVLCLEDRTVIGAVAETLGRVQEPFYSVAFSKPSDIADIGIVQGTKILYVDSHSTFVFTQPLKNLKGTDASNLHDEEVADEEMEFSDDEAEAAYKKAKKEARRGARPSGSAPSWTDAPMDVPVQTQQYMPYDDAEAEDMYTPLSRPSNLQDMMTGAPQPLEQRTQRPFSDRGRGRGGRGRGDRGRGRGGRGARGGRGGHDSPGQRSGASQSFPDAHNGQHQQAAAPPQTWAPPMPFSAQQFQQPAQAQQYHHPQQYQPPVAYPQQQQQQPFAWPQFTQQQYSPAGLVPPPPPFVTTQGSGAHTPVPPPGAFYNSAFFANHQQHSQFLPPAQSPNGLQAQNPQAYQAVQQQLEILRRLHGSPP